MEPKFQKVKAVQDDSGHWYVIPADQIENFYTDLEDENINSTGEFDNIYGKYRTYGDLNLIQLYAIIE